LFKADGHFVAGFSNACPNIKQHWRSSQVFILQISNGQRASELNPRINFEKNSLVDRVLILDTDP